MGSLVSSALRRAARRDGASSWPGRTAHQSNWPARSGRNPSWTQEREASRRIAKRPLGLVKTGSAFCYWLDN